MSDGQAQLCQARIGETIVHQDLMITTICSPWGPAPRLLSGDMVNDKERQIKPNYSDEIIAAVMLTRQGALVHPHFEIRIHS